MTNVKTVSIGKMPGRLNTYALDANTTVAKALETAGLTVGNFEVKVDGTTITNFNQTIALANTILLSERIKGNAPKTVSVGKMPGRLDTYAVESTQSFAQVLALASLQVGNFEVKADGTTVTDLNAPIGSANTILLTEKVKGN